ncbi:MAG: hypothetical protein JNL70_23770 [Saprospiraceae bacterium]|nr:hypothetical protein [Saprospiraceae bacterium]
MKYFFSFILLIIMMLTTMDTLIVQLQLKDMPELLVDDMDADDCEGKVKTEKEKETFIYNAPLNLQIRIQLFRNTKKTTYHKHDNLISEQYVLLPEIPPEA